MAKSNDTNLKNLLEDIACGKIQLPEFQRSWTWDDNHIRGIIASVTLGYPMGAVMALEYGNPDIIIKYRTIEGVTPPSENNAQYFYYNDSKKNWESISKPDLLILDGQQRLTSLYQALYSSKPVKTKTETNKEIERFYYLSIEKCLDESEDRFDAIISLPKDKIIKTNFDRDILLDISDREKEFKNKLFPLNIVFASELLQWQMEYFQYYMHDPDSMKQLQIFNDNIIKKIVSYQLPVITLDKSTQREAVCKVFENVNTGGVALTVFELVTASFATQDFDLRKDWEHCKKIIAAEAETLRTDIFDGIDATLFLTAVTLYTNYTNKVSGKIGFVSCKKKDILALKYDSYINNKEAVLMGFKLARRFLLHYQSVYRLRDLPYTTQIIPLAAICAVLGESKFNEANSIKILSQWYWCGILGEMYGGANETRYANDIEDVVDEIYGIENKKRTINNAFFSATRLLSLQTRNSAAYKGIIALLYKKQCHDFMNNITIKVIESMEESPDIHHIFPEAYCIKHNIPKKKYNSIVNKTPLLPKTNRIIGGNAPSKYLQRILKNVDGLQTDQLQKRIESHLISYDYLSHDDFDNYFIDRAKRLLDSIEEAMGKPVSDRGTENTLQQFGQSLV